VGPLFFVGTLFLCLFSPLGSLVFYFFRFPAPSGPSPRPDLLLRFPRSQSTGVFLTLSAPNFPVLPSKLFSFLSFNVFVFFYTFHPVHYFCRATTKTFPFTSSRPPPWLFDFPNPRFPWCLVVQLQSRTCFFFRFFPLPAQPDADLLINYPTFFYHCSASHLHFLLSTLYFHLQLPPADFSPWRFSSTTLFSLVPDFKLIILTASVPTNDFVLRLGTPVNYGRRPLPFLAPEALTLISFRRSSFVRPLLVERFFFSHP